MAVTGSTLARRVSRQLGRTVEFAFTRRHKLAALAQFVVRRGRARCSSRDRCPRAPAALMLRLTHRCNLSCFFCGQHGVHGLYREVRADTPEMGLDHWKSLIDQVAAFRPYLLVTGGEPLLRADVSDLLAHAAQRGLLTHLSTNGCLLASRAHELVAAELDYISVSLNALPCSSQAITGAPETHHQVLQGIRRLQAAKASARTRFPLVQVFTTLNQANQGHLYQLGQAANQVGADVWVLSYPIFTTPELAAQTRAMYRLRLGQDARHWDGFVADLRGIDSTVVRQELERIAKGEWDLVCRQIPEVSAFDVERHFRRPEEPHAPGPCALPWTLAVVLPNGDMATCWDHPDYVVGNVLATPFLGIWQGPRYLRFRQVVAEQPFPSCGRCTGMYYRL